LALGRDDFRRPHNRDLINDPIGMLPLAFAEISAVLVQIVSESLVDLHGSGPLLQIKAAVTTRRLARRVPMANM
jgi:hypothetical protein